MKLSETVTTAKVASDLYLVSWATPKSASARKFATEAEAVAYADKTRARLAKRYDTPEAAISPRRIVAKVAEVLPIVGSADHMARIEREARKLMTEHGLTASGWAFRWDNRATKRAGACWYGERRLGFSSKLFRLWTFEAARNTILHEIAHALVGLGHGHDAVWSAKHVELGGDGKRYWSTGDGRVRVPTKPRRRKVYNPLTGWAYV